MNQITKKRGVRALVASGIAGAGLVAVTMGGSPATGQKYPCYYPQDRVARIIVLPDCETPSTRPEITTTTAAETTTTAAQTTTTEDDTPTTTRPAQTTTTVAPGSTTSTTVRPGGVSGGGAAPARPIAAQASYTG